MTTDSSEHWYIKSLDRTRDWMRNRVTSRNSLNENKIIQINMGLEY